MSAAAPPLVLLTAAFPYGDKSETFLEAEIPVLAERFSTVHVLPSRRAGPQRPLPDGAHVVEMPWLDPLPRAARLRALAGVDAAAVLGPTLARPAEWTPWLGSVRELGDRLAVQAWKAGALREWVMRQELRDAVFYDYWFENSTVALARLRREGTIRTAVSRAHGFDLYDERWEGRTVPFRSYKLGGLDRVYAVSRFGADYLRRKAPSRADLVETSYLGVAEPAAPSPPPDPAEPPLVVSCGSLLPSKRFHLVPAALARLGRPVRWVHLGDGPERPRVAEAAREAAPAVTSELRGHVPNQDVLGFYAGRPVSLFVSPSVSEGLPVSMMEAIAHGIPLVGMDVQGVPEIVGPDTGVLVPPDASLDDLAEAVRGALEPGRFDRDAVRRVHRERFHADTNYHAFADGLLDLR